MFRQSDHFGLTSTEDQGEDGPSEEGAFRSLDGLMGNSEEQHASGDIRQPTDLAFRFQYLSQPHQQPINHSPADFSDPPHLRYTAGFREETPEQKKRRKNREAAARCQKRKKEQTEMLKREVEYLGHLVDQLKTGLAAEPMAYSAGSGHGTYVAPMAPMSPIPSRRTGMESSGPPDTEAGAPHIAFAPQAIPSSSSRIPTENLPLPIQSISQGLDSTTRYYQDFI